jgi:hypothetical protein
MHITTGTVLTKAHWGTEVKKKALYTYGSKDLQS